MSGSIPGSSGAGSPLYKLDVAVDRLMLQVGSMDPGAVVHERSSEALVADRRNALATRQAALNRMNEVAAVASSNDTRGLEKAIAVLEAVKEWSQVRRTPV